MSESAAPSLNVTILKAPTTVSTLPQTGAPAAAGGPAVAAPASRRFSLRKVILPIIVLGALAYGASKGYDYFTTGRFLVSTDDAYVGEKNAILSPKVAGHVVEVLVANNQAVKQGDVLVRIDGGDYKLAVDQAKAKIATQDATILRIAKQVEAQAANIQGAQAQVQAAAAQAQSAEADQQRSGLEYDRSQKLAQTNFGSQQRLEQAAADKSRANAALASAQAASASAEAQLAGAKSNLDVLKAQKVEAERTRDELTSTAERAARDLTFTQITAPFDGIVGNKAVEVGMYAQPGQRLLALIATSEPYVDANFKETQLSDLKVGQRVDVTVDALGGRTLKGFVASIAPATGSQFSLLPPDNATGNFTKITQRDAVRIKFKPEDLGDAVLRPGFSAVASVHTRSDDQPKPTLLGALGFDGGSSN